MMPKYTHFTCWYAALGFLFVAVACSQPNPVGKINPLSTNQVSVQQENNIVKGPYNGPISLKIDTGLATQTQGKVIDLNEWADDFQIASASQTPALFTEQIQVNGSGEITKALKITDTSQRYTLLVERSHPSAQVEVNINGTVWVNPAKFAWNKNKVEIKTLLLQANNSIRIKTWGKGSVTVKLIPGGQAGTVFKRQTKFDNRILTQEERLKRNDTNIFNPDDPDSLGGLEPYEGDIIIPERSYFPPMGLAVANDSQALISVGYLNITVSEPINDKLSRITQKYPVLVVEDIPLFGEHWIQLKIDLSKVNLTDLQENIQFANQRALFPSLSDAVFSSVNTAKTIALAYEMLKETEDLFSSVVLNNINQDFSAGPVLTTEQNSAIDMNPKINPTIQALFNSNPIQALTSEHLWWLKDSKITEAWNYSMGHQVNVAVLDDGFGYIQNNPEYSSRTGVNGGAIDLDYLMVLKPIPYDDQLQKINEGQSPNELYSGPGHGLWVSEIIGAQANNKIGITGAAPNANIIPMALAENSDTTVLSQLNKIYNQTTPIDVINISSGRMANFFDYIFSYNFRAYNPTGSGANCTYSDFSGCSSLAKPTVTLLKELAELVQKLNDRAIITVSTAGNKSFEVHDYDINDPNLFAQNIIIPGSVKGIITVGAYEKVNSIDQRAIFDEAGYKDFLLTLFFSLFGIESEKQAEKMFNVFRSGSLDLASNYGPDIEIWAPGDDMFVRDEEFKRDTVPSYQPKFHPVQGTSFAAPIVTSVIALAKSWNKNLKYEDIVDILQTQSESITIENSNALKLNALKFIQDPRIGAKPAVPLCLQYKPNDPTSVKSWPKLTTLMPTIVDGDYVDGIGWSQTEKSSLANNTIELISATRRSAPCPGSSFNVLSTDQPKPPEVDVWIQGNDREVDVQPGQEIGLGFNAASLEGLELRIGGQVINIRNLAQQASQNPNHWYASFQIPLGLQEDVYDIIINLAGQQYTFEQAIKILAMPNPVEIQQLPTTGGFGIDHSGMNGDIYLGIANRREGDDFSVDSDVFKWDGALFNYFQSIPTFTGSDMEFFELNASRYLAVANASGGFSKLYQWNGSQFVPVQDLRSGLNALKHIEFNGQHFLFGSGDASLTPVAYRWNGSLFQAIQSGDLLNIGFTEHVDAFQSGNTLYAVFGVTTTNPNSSPNTNSRIMQWTGSRFIHTQTIPTVRAQGVEAFEMNGETYLAIANHGPINDNQANSTIYKWNGSQFNSIQSVATQAGHSWKHFHSEGVDYLALAEGGNPARFFYWDGTQFVHFRTIEHLGFWEFDFVDTGLKRLLVGSFYGEGTTFLEPSYVYEFR